MKQGRGELNRKRTIDYVEFIEANYLLIASGNNQQGYNLANQLGHSIIKPVPSLFTFKIDDKPLTVLSGITFPKVKASLKLEPLQTNISELTQVGPMLVTHWGLRTLLVDFSPDVHSEDLKSLLSQHKKKKIPKQKVVGLNPPELGLVKRFWKYLLNRDGIDEDILWASI
ncbi:putative 3-Dehydro-bile acid delta(4,6)-reductase, FAD/NAD(P)-binding domain superfamily [Helianthus anomalus]